VPQSLHSEGGLHVEIDDDEQMPFSHPVGELSLPSSSSLALLSLPSSLPSSSGELLLPSSSLSLPPELLLPSSAPSEPVSSPLSVLSSPSEEFPLEDDDESDELLEDDEELEFEFELEFESESELPDEFEFELEFELEFDVFDVLLWEVFELFPEEGLSSPPSSAQCSGQRISAFGYGWHESSSTGPGPGGESDSSQQNSHIQYVFGTSEPYGPHGLTYCPVSNKISACSQRLHSPVVQLQSRTV